MDAQTLILNKLDSIDRKIDRFNQRMSTLEAKTEPLFDNGQEGQVTKLDNRVRTLEEVRWKAAGIGGAFLILLEIVGHLVWHKLTLGQ